MLFVGEGVRIRAPQNIQAGRNLSLHENVYVDGLCEQGLVFGDNVTIREHSIIESTGILRAPGEGLVVGNNVGISQHAFIGVRGKIVIGDNVIMGPYVKIYAANHNFENPNLLIKDQGESRKGIVIEEDCWLGAGCTILDGVHIGKGSVIAAGSVVTKDIPPFSIVGGVPGKVIKQRGSQSQAGAVINID
jgi:acetyltransferase-like isoleucine patch superfamily enzyme